MSLRIDRWVRASTRFGLNTTYLEDDVLAQVLVRQTNELPVRFSSAEPQLQRRGEPVWVEVEGELDEAAGVEGGRHGRGRTRQSGAARVAATAARVEGRLADSARGAGSNSAL